MDGRGISRNALLLSTPTTPHSSQSNTPLLSTKLSRVRSPLKSYNYISGFNIHIVSLQDITASKETNS
jgi:hypothetical protein